jgi:hypothetical protein
LAAGATFDLKVDNRSGPDGAKIFSRIPPLAQSTFRKFKAVLNHKSRHAGAPPQTINYASMRHKSFWLD